MIERLYNQSTAITRMALNVDGESSSLTTVSTISCHIQQARPEFAQQIGQAWGKVFLLWCAVSADIKSGDTVTIASGDYVGTYSVSNIQKNATGRNQHLECALLKDLT